MYVKGKFDINVRRVVITKTNDLVFKEVNYMQNQSPNIAVPIAIVVSGMLISAGIFFGMQMGSNNTSTTTPNTLGANVSPAAPTVAQGPTFGTVSIDDDAVLGEADAPVTVVEFSDYECPYCKQSFTTMQPQLISEYVNTGKVKFVFKDFPLYFHDPAATTMAMAANCAFEQGNDETYYEMHDLIFNTTPGNGTGITMDKLVELATSLKLNGSEFKQCVEDKKYADEIAGDLKEGQTAGVGGTPSYVIGKSTADGKFEGEVVVGAVPFASLKTTIEKYLK